jgi:hypothetical protein
MTLHYLELQRAAAARLRNPRPLSSRTSNIKIDGKNFYTLLNEELSKQSTRQFGHEGKLFQLILDAETILKLHGFYDKNNQIYMKELNSGPGLDKMLEQLKLLQEGKEAKVILSDNQARKLLEQTLAKDKFLVKYEQDVAEGRVNISDFKTHQSNIEKISQSFSIKEHRPKFDFNIGYSDGKISWTLIKGSDAITYRKGEGFFRRDVSDDSDDEYLYHSEKTLSKSEDDTITTAEKGAAITTAHHPPISVLNTAIFSCCFLLFFPLYNVWKKKRSERNPPN